METSPPDLTNIREVMEIDHGGETRSVNEAIAKGWVLLRIRTVTKKVDENIVEYPIYILGLPSS